MHEITPSDKKESYSDNHDTVDWEVDILVIFRKF